MQRYRSLLLTCMLAATAGAGAQTVTESRLGEGIERQLSTEQPAMQWVRDPDRVKKDGGDTLQKQQVASEELETIKVENVIPPIHFDSGVANIPDSYIELLRNTLDKLRDRRNVRLHLVGHADTQRLSEALARVYGDNAGLSRERAGQVAELLKRALNLPPEAIAYEWLGDTHPIASNDTAEGRALNRRVEVEVWYDQPNARLKDEDVLVHETVKQIKVCRVQTLCVMRFKEGAARRERLNNLVPALHYGEENADITPQFLEQIHKAFDHLRDKQNVVVKLIGYTDNAPLSARDERIYADHLSLSKAKAHRVALAVQEALKLPSAAVASDGRGDAAPLGSNETAQGRATNRRIEVQFWYDEPLQELPDGPQLCPRPDSAEMVTKVYDPPSGNIPRLELQNGRAIIPPGYTDSLRRAMDDIKDRTNVRLRFVGYTANERLDRRTAAVYGDDVGLSAARARRAMETVRDEMHLAPSQAEHEGRGFVQSNDVVNAGFTQGESSYVVVQVVYDEPAALDDLEGIDITRLTRELTPKSPFGLNPMHITVDGVPLDDPDRSSADVQRCTDVALDKADIQFRFDNLKSRRRLSVVASPRVVAYQLSKEDGLVAPRVRFSMYSNYGAFIDKAEVRIFNAEQSVQGAPLAVVAVDADGVAEWQPGTEQAVSAQGRELKYVLRAYGKSGQFDDTKPRTLWMIRDPGVYAGPEPHTTPIVPDTEGEVEAAAEADTGPPGVTTNFEQPDSSPPAATAEDPKQHQELLAGYGESSIAIENIRVNGGTVTVHGGGIPPKHTVWVAGHPVPVDAQGNFVAEEVLPPGTHTVEVAVLDEEGNGTLYLRDLEFKPKDRFFVAMADVTASKTHTTGPADTLQGQNAPFDYDSTLSGSLSFFGTQKLSNDWRITASADTREEPLHDLFTNFLNKAPDSLFRRIDPDYYYPTFGDDSVVQELAPTLGKFYLKAQRDDDYALWGNFKINYAQNELAQVNRGLYGANAHWDSNATTSFGEKRVVVDAFGAQPGTVASREEFRGTGGSVYFLHNQDILTGSESLWIELRDKDSFLVTGTVNLRPSIDYEVDYLQGRVLLSEPLSAVANDNLLVRSNGLSGQEAYLVVRYEYTPGLQQIYTVTTGGQGDVWLNDYVKLGLTGSSNDQGEGNSGLRGADLTLRKSTDSWMKLQGARSEGLVSSPLYSADGGYAFTGLNPTSFNGSSATGYRADASVGLADFLAGTKGKVTLYTQNLDAGYSAPGLDTLTQTQYYGGTLKIPVGERLTVSGKVDRRAQNLGLQTQQEEVDVGYQMTKQWTVSTGVRRDERTDRSPVVPLTQEQGERTDAVAQLAYDSLASWRAYTFVQDTVSKSADREANGRIGVGGSYRLTNRLRIEAEGSGGDLGPGGKLGTSYMYSDRSSLYLNYSLENERQDTTGLIQRQGNLISGVKTRWTDSTSVYVEERYQDADQASGLTHATGITLTPDERWSIGANTEIGTLIDSQTDAQTKRKAGAVRVGYTFQTIRFSSGIEYRDDQTQAPDTSLSKRTTWLFRNNFKYQITPDWRVVGKLDHSMSNSSLGEFYDGGFTEAVIGYGYRPVRSDRLDVLAKYTYFYNVPAPDQVTPQNTVEQFIQRSHIASVDVTYDLSQHWSIGGKYAYRLGSAALDRTNPQFFDNTAMLYIGRVDWKFGPEWEGMVEGRALQMPDLNETRAGALVALYRHLGKHVKAGAGYNFTNFSDDLTDLSFRQHGIFLNVVGSM